MRHADAGHAELSLALEQRGVVLQVSDDGCGVDDEELESSYGIRGMRERAVLIGATLTIDTERGQGTRLVLCLPMES